VGFLSKRFKENHKRAGDGAPTALVLSLLPWSAPRLGFRHGTGCRGAAGSGSCDPALAVIAFCKTLLQRLLVLGGCIKRIVTSRSREVLPALPG